MAKSRSRLPALLFLPAIAVLCLGGFLAFNFILSLPSRAANTFGPPSNGLTTYQHYKLSAQLWWDQMDLLAPADPAGEERTFAIDLGESTASVIQRLADEGLIRNAQAFRNYLIYSGYDTRLQAGTYNLSPAMTPVEIAQEMLDATPEFIKLAILPGWRLEEIAASLPTSGLEVTPEEFLALARSRPAGYAFVPEVPPNDSLEGFFLPGTYELPRGLSAVELLVSLLENFDQQVGPELRDGFANQGLILREAVSLASIVQREAVVQEEQPQIASVFLNRLDASMRLDADPTVQYALGYVPEMGTWWKSPLSEADLQIDSPYNTYLYPGLPPGPIANPSLSALQAVAFAAQTPYYYFRAACDGSGRHVFSETFEQHQANACP